MFDQGTPEWMAERSGKVTASALSNVMMAKTTAGYQNYMAQLICERLTGQPVETFKSSAMEYGTATEPQARAFYELESGNTVKQVGFVHHPTIANCGASPDGLIGTDGGLELKVPQPAKHIKNLMGGPIDKPYILQMQWCMACTGRDWWHYGSFNPTFPDHLKLHVQRVSRDDAMIDEIAFAVVRFLSDVDEKLQDLDGLAK